VDSQQARELASVDALGQEALVASGELSAVELLDAAITTTRAFFDVEFATTGWTTMANVTGWAAISLPLGVTSVGLPIGVQLMVPDETVLLRLAAQLEVAMPWSGGLPAGWIG
jgi:amidase